MAWRRTSRCAADAWSSIASDGCSRPPRRWPRCSARPARQRVARDAAVDAAARRGRLPEDPQRRARRSHCRRRPRLSRHRDRDRQRRIVGSPRARGCSPPARRSTKRRTPSLAGYVAGAAVSTSRCIGRLRLDGDTLLYPVGGRVEAERRPRSATSSSAAASRTRRKRSRPSRCSAGLIGSEAAIVVGNADGSAWTDLIERGDRRADPRRRPRSAVGLPTRRACRASSRGRRRFDSTPWIVAIEFPRAVVLAPRDRLARRVVGDRVHVAADRRRDRLGDHAADHHAAAPRHRSRRRGGRVAARHVHVDIDRARRDRTARRFVQHHDRARRAGAPRARAARRAADRGAERGQSRARSRSAIPCRTTCARRCARLSASCRSSRRITATSLDADGAPLARARQGQRARAWAS